MPEASGHCVHTMMLVGTAEAAAARLLLLCVGPVAYACDVAGIAYACDVAGTVLLSSLLAPAFHGRSFQASVYALPN